MKRFLGVLLVATVLSLAQSADAATEWYQPGFGWVWQPQEWNYVSGDLVYSPSDWSWMWIEVDYNGPYTYSYITHDWWYGIFNGWNYFVFNSAGIDYSDYYYFNNSIFAWYYMWTGPDYVWYYNLTYGHWGRIY